MRDCIKRWQGDSLWSLSFYPRALKKEASATNLTAQTLISRVAHALEPGVSARDTLPVAVARVRCAHDVHPVCACLAGEALCACAAEARELILLEALTSVQTRPRGAQVEDAAPRP